MSDYIKRDSVLNDIGELFTLCYETLPNECGHHFIVENELKIHWDYIKELPAEDVRENKHGKWIKYPIGELICSNCGHRRVKNALGDRQHWFALPKFCEACGAVMDGVSE